MLKRCLIIIFTVLGLWHFTYAASSRDIKQIRQRYNQVNSGRLNIQSHQIFLNVIYAAIGLQKTSINFFHIAEQAAPERDPYLMKFKLLKVSVNYNIAASRKIFQEYLFNKKGQLIFYYRKITDPNEKKKIYQERYYLKKGKLIRVIVKGVETGYSDRHLNYTRDKHFKKRNILRLNQIKTASIRYKKLFDSLLATEKMK